MHAWRFHRDYYAGALMLLTGFGVIAEGRSYNIGTLSHMGPGFVPVSLGIILAICGVGIAAGARRAVPDTARPAPEWRAWFCILLSIAAFIVLGQYGGLLPASFAISFIAALGDRDNTALSAAGLAIGVCVVAVVVFWWALRLQIPLFTWGT